MFCNDSSMSDPAATQENPCFERLQRCYHCGAARYSQYENARYGIGWPGVRQMGITTNIGFRGRASRIFGVRVLISLVQAILRSVKL